MEKIMPHNTTPPRETIKEFLLEWFQQLGGNMEAVPTRGLNVILDDIDAARPDDNRVAMLIVTAIHTIEGYLTGPTAVDKASIKKLADLNPTANEIITNMRARDLLAVGPSLATGPKPTAGSEGRNELSK